MFKDWLKKKHYKEGLADNDNPVEKYNFNKDNDSDFAEDQDRTEVELFKIIMRKYPEETMDFFQTMSRRGDAEISNLIKKLDRNSVPKLSLKPKHSPNFDEIVPSSADSGYNNMGEQE
jgi:hypothetical protein